jgi:threonine dehydrogenase-like Zn-dependent dehydrogenase
VEDSQLNRRDFLGKTIAGVAITAASYRQVLGANDRLQLANIGCGRRGLLKEALQVKDRTNATVVAVCDTWRQRREEATKAVQDAGGSAPKQFVHYQEVLALKDVDAVIILSKRSITWLTSSNAVEAANSLLLPSTPATVIPLRR